LASIGASIALGANDEAEFVLAGVTVACGVNATTRVGAVLLA
jgi:hypothetical protein